MQYGIVGASFAQGTLAVFHAGLADDVQADYQQATQKALRLLVSELASTSLPDIHQLHDAVVEYLQGGTFDVQQLDEATADCLTLSLFDDDHFVINVMDATEAFQLHIEVLPLVAGGSSLEA